MIHHKSWYVIWLCSPWYDQFILLSSKKLIMLITSRTYLHIYTIYLTVTSLSTYLQDLHILIIRYSSSKLSLGKLSLFYHLIELSNILGVSQSRSDIDERSSRIVFVTQLISTKVAEVMIFLEERDVAGGIIS